MPSLACRCATATNSTIPPWLSRRWAKSSNGITRFNSPKTGRRRAITYRCSNSPMCRAPSSSATTSAIPNWPATAGTRRGACPLLPLTRIRTEAGSEAQSVLRSDSGAGGREHRLHRSRQRAGQRRHDGIARPEPSHRAGRQSAWRGVAVPRRNRRGETRPHESDRRQRSTQSHCAVRCKIGGRTESNRVRIID